MEHTAFAYDPAEWTDFFVAAAGAAAALAGLVFVAVSINIERILESPGLAERGLMTVLVLLVVLVVSLIGLIPGQDREILGAELLVTGVLFTLVIASQSLASDTSHVTTRQAVARHMLVASATIPVIVGGATLIAEAGGGLYWVAGAIVLAFVAGIMNAWVLLVEILR